MRTKLLNESGRALRFVRSFFSSLIDHKGKPFQIAVIGRGVKQIEDFHGKVERLFPP